MLKRKQLIVLAVVLLLCFILCACGSANKPKGTYVGGVIKEDPVYTLVFKGNTVEEIYHKSLDGFAESESGTFKMDGDRIIVYYDNGMVSELGTYNKHADTIHGIFVYEKVK